MNIQFIILGDGRVQRSDERIKRNTNYYLSGRSITYKLLLLLLPLPTAQVPSGGPLDGPLPVSLKLPARREGDHEEAQQATLNAENLSSYSQQ